MTGKTTRKHKYNSIITAIVFCFSIISCSEIVRTEATELIPTGEKTYRFKAFADITHPLESESAEKERIRWLEKWLTDNNCENCKYQIINRTPVRQKTLLGEVYDIYYDIELVE